MKKTGGKAGGKQLILNRKSVKMGLVGNLIRRNNRPKRKYAWLDEYIKRTREVAMEQAKKNITYIVYEKDGKLVRSTLMARSFHLIRMKNNNSVICTAFLNLTKAYLPKTKELFLRNRHTKAGNDWMCFV